ncbi:MAG: hypothetical protein Q9P90_15085 [candidate division KSB1 bacterium]|nr:hypothetical protein [candidate division KSB1 bacterium]
MAVTGFKTRPTTLQHVLDLPVNFTAIQFGFEITNIEVKEFFAGIANQTAIGRINFENAAPCIRQDESIQHALKQEFIAMQGMQNAMFALFGFRMVFNPPSGTESSPGLDLLLQRTNTVPSSTQLAQELLPGLFRISHVTPKNIGFGFSRPAVGSESAIGKAGQVEITGKRVQKNIRSSVGNLSNIENKKHFSGQAHTVCQSPARIIRTLIQIIERSSSFVLQMQSIASNNNLAYTLPFVKGLSLFSQGSGWKTGHL